MIKYKACTFACSLLTKLDLALIENIVAVHTEYWRLRFVARSFLFSHHNLWRGLTPLKMTFICL